MSFAGWVAGWPGADARRVGAVAAAVAALAGAAAIWSAGGSGAPPAGLAQQFRDAGRAYAEGHMSEAARLYEGLTRRGYASTEVFYNLGNAQLKEGRVGPAVLNYRKAWRLAPRDPDVGANLRIARQTAGAAEADLSSGELAFTLLSEGEWAAVAVAAWWGLCLVLSLATLLPSGRWLLLRFAALAAVVALAALFGLWTWRGFERNPELVILHDTQNALVAPLASSSPRFSLAEGSVVRSGESRGEWVEVTHGQLSGWVRRAACAPVLLDAAPG
ncbi:MAG TPA: hypothetical protein VN317_06260 [Candidatus Methanoperedens sp.]|nr:hypothetical protein [Candidatus Methanoperedens sp.]